MKSTRLMYPTVVEKLCQHKYAIICDRTGACGAEPQLTRKNLAVLKC